MPYEASLVIEYLLQHVCGAVANVQIWLFVDLEIFIIFVHELLCVLGRGAEQRMSVEHTGKTTTQKWSSTRAFSSAAVP
jgi:hypothetical protein